MHPLIKLAIFIGAALVAMIVFIHMLPWIIGILAVYGLFKLYHWLNQPRDNRPLPRWPWRDDR